MDDATLGRVMTYVGLGLGIAPVLLLLLLGHRVLIDALLGLCRWKGLLARILRGGLSLFTGLMLASAVGVLVPQLWLPSAHLLCDGQVEVTSQNYSYKPGQHGTNMAVICTAATGTQTKITLASIFLSALLYGGALFVLMELVGLMLRTFQRDTPAFASRPSPVSRPPGAPRRFASFFPRTDTAKSASATLITNHSVSIDSVKDLQNLAKTVRQTLPGNMGAVIQQALDAAAHEHSGSPSVIADEQQIDPGSDDLIARLQKLKKLHEAGLIDNDEYAAKKSDLLKNL